MLCYSCDLRIDESVVMIWMFVDELEKREAVPGHTDHVVTTGVIPTSWMIRVVYDPGFTVHLVETLTQGHLVWSTDIEVLATPVRHQMPQDRGI